MRKSVFEPNSALPPHGHVPSSEAMGWKSPVPYLFGGLAAMLGLIAFALLILACSYWKLSGYLDSSAGGDSDAGEGKAGDDGGKEKTEAVLRKSVLVIMAGEAQPTFIAMPAAKTASCVGSCSCGDGRGEEEEGRGEKEVVEMVVRGGGGGGDGGGGGAGSSDEAAAVVVAEEKR